MKNLWQFILKNQSFIYKGLLLIGSSFLIVYLFPKGGTFKYEFQKGKPWQHPTLYAPFDYSIIKSESELENEKTGQIYSYRKALELVTLPNEFVFILRQTWKI